jgi:hypothetical protein
MRLVVELPLAIIDGGLQWLSFKGWDEMLWNPSKISKISILQKLGFIFIWINLLLQYHT